MPAEEFKYDYWTQGRFEHPGQFISLRERDRRWDRIREEMSKLGLDCILAYCGPMGCFLSGMARYITNCHGFNDGWVLLPIKGNPVLFPWNENIEELAKRQVWPGVDIAIGGTVGTWAVANQVKEYGYEKGTIGIVGLSDYHVMEGWVPYTSYMNLQRFLPEAEFKDATAMISDIKMIKSEEEIQLIEKASDIADKAIEAMAKHAKPGVMEHELWAIIMYTVISLGGDASWTGSQHLMTVGDWLWQAYAVPQHHMIKNGDVLLTEFYPRYAGYLSHPHQPILFGEVHQDYERCYQVLLQSIKEGLKVLTPEHTWIEAGEAFARPIREAGMYSVIPMAAHGIGITMPEPPWIPMSGVERRKTKPEHPGLWVEAVPELEFMWKKSQDLLNRKIEPGVVLTIEPRAVIGEEHRGLHMGPTVVTTEGYPRLLTRYGREAIRI